MQPVCMQAPNPDFIVRCFVLNAFPDVYTFGPEAIFAIHMVEAFLQLYFLRPCAPHAHPWPLSWVGRAGLVHAQCSLQCTIFINHLPCYLFCSREVTAMN